MVEERSLGETKDEREKDESIKMQPLRVRELRDDERIEKRS